jgi:hypothetical protein
MAEEVKMVFNENGQGHFFIADEEEEIAKMEFEISGDHITVSHSEVLPKAEGKGMAKKLFLAMVEYAEKNHLKVTPVCSYVHSQLERNPSAYQSIWEEEK